MIDVGVQDEALKGAALLDGAPYEGDVFHAQIADASPAYIWLLDPQGRNGHVNLSAHRFQPDSPIPTTTSLPAGRTAVFRLDSMHDRN